MNNDNDDEHGPLISNAFRNYLPISSRRGSDHAELFLGPDKCKGGSGKARSASRERLLLKRYGTSRRFSCVEAGDLRRATLEYQRRLVRTGWLLPALHELSTYRVGDEKQIWLVEEYISGYDCIHVFQSFSLGSGPGFVVIDQFVNLVERLRPEPSEHVVDFDGLPIPLVEIGVDAKPGNFRVTVDFELRLIDCFPPLIRAQLAGDKLRFPLLYKFSVAKLWITCFTRPGIVVRFIRLIILQCGYSHSRLFVERLISSVDSSSLSSIEKLAIFREVSGDFPMLRKLYGE